MKIGILTYHRSYNYGALLQAIALRNVLTNLGHEAFFIDYWPEHNKHRYSLFSFSWMMKTQRNFSRKVSYLVSCIRNYQYRKNRNESFKCFISEYILPYTSSMDDSYDVVIHGSDQIWRKQPEINTYNPIYFGHHDIKASRKISYAASIGDIPSKESDKSIIANYVSSLDSISVRENELKLFLKVLGFKDVKTVLDPTLLLNSNSWINLLNLHYSSKAKPYILYYELQKSFDYNEIDKFARSNNLKVQMVSGRYHPKNDMAEEIVNPIRFVELIANSSFVFTSSFHGLVFALLFHKPFYASFSNNSTRAFSLLSILNLLDYLIQPNSILSQLKYHKIDFQKVDEVLSSLRKESISFLVNATQYKLEK